MTPEQAIAGAQVRFLEEGRWRFGRVLRVRRGGHTVEVRGEPERGGPERGGPALGGPERGARGDDMTRYEQIAEDQRLSPAEPDEPCALCGDAGRIDDHLCWRCAEPRDDYYTRRVPAESHLDAWVADRRMA